MKNIEIKIKTEFIKLDALLKYANVVSSGGVAKDIISQGVCKFNGEVCLQRGKKIRVNDIVEVLLDGETFKITIC